MIQNMPLIVNKIATYLGNLKPSDLRTVARWLDESKRLIVAIAAWVSFSVIAIRVAVHAILDLFRSPGF